MRQSLILFSLIFLTACGDVGEEQRKPHPEIIQAKALVLYAPKAEDYSNELDWIRSIRTWVNENSYHKGSDRPANYGYMNAELYISLMESYLTGNGDLPFLQCGDRAIVMVRLLQALGVRARTVNIYRSDSSGHIFLEYFSHDLGKWIVQDPDYNVDYQLVSGEPASLEDLITKNTNSYQPLGGWDEKTYGLITNEYLNIGLIHETNTWIYREGENQ